MRTKIFFYCPDCNRQNYFSTKNKTKTQENKVLKKFCGNCRKVVPHQEKKK